ncbi:HAMP domain-containing sensor histidine kinase [Fodinibius sp.]|uniref:sensor histidine kinase n=1 Tax=Fodinibius sp. TaxID=1872440 RepID=UPI002ACE1557|nr:HAMP domain-containing sensor histidine kinase [Fodinibius sp.]MDZ7660400.1 HAMP domain-containing sensor histidine kinase [Fodinibius sp.]
MRKKPFQRSSRLAFRSAIYAGLLIGIAAGVAAKFLLNTAFTNSLLLGGGMFLLSGIIVYVIIYKQQFSRLETLNQINKNILNKRFRDYEELKTKNHDELDYLIKQTVRASKTVEREIQRLNRIENYRKEFIGDISHELKTPIFAIQGFIETLLNGAIDDAEVNRKFLEKAMRNVNRLIYLTKDLMEISKLETGELKSDIQDFNLKELIVEVVNILQYKADKADVLLKTNIPHVFSVSADRNQIKQVLINLVDNAIKYNVEGGKVTVGVKSWAEDESRVLVYVKDTGIGISQQHIERVTERFFRVDKSRSREDGEGTGLGLAIVKHIIKAHDEELFIESTPKVSSSFSFTLSKVDRTSAEAELTN